MGRGCNPEKSAVVPLVGWGVISLKKCRYWGAALPPRDRIHPAPSAPLVGCALIPLKKRRCLGAALPPDDGTPQAAIELGSIPLDHIYSII